ncbi:MAG: tetratricopeptide repeat protein [Firmicutes bacterium]|nr:tetratricopeptide repeat protein [Bacillota bacterium]
MKDNKKKRRSSSFIGLFHLFMVVLIGAVITLIKRYVGMEMLQYVIMMICVIATYGIIVVIITELKTIKRKKKCESILRILLDEKNTDKFIKEMEDAYKRYPDRSLNNYIITNLAAGYSCRGNYEKANELLKEINSKKLKDADLAAYYGDIIENYFRMGYVDEARKLLNQKNDFIKMYTNNQNCGSVINLCYALDSLTAGNFPEGRVFLEKAKSLCTIDVTMDIINMDFAKLLVAEGDVEGAEREMQTLSKSRVVPCVRIEMDKLRKFIIAQF